METHGPLGTLWVGIGLCAFYLALIWVNTLLGIMLTPLFLVPGTWLMDWLGVKRRDKNAPAESPPAASRAAPRT